MATDTDICNSALSKIRGRLITSLNDNSTEARLCKVLYPRIREAALRKHSWRFAITRVALGLLDETPEYGFDYAFQLPPNCLRVLETDSFEGDDWTQEGTKILANRDTFNCKIIYLETDAEKYDPVFCELLAFELAAQLALPLTNGTTIAAGMAQEAEKILREARSYSAQEKGSIEVPEATSWLNSRY